MRAAWFAVGAAIIIVAVMLYQLVPYLVYLNY